jgi:hypothetical protein
MHISVLSSAMCASNVVSPFFLFDSSLNKKKKREIVERIKKKANFFLFYCSTLLVLNYQNGK